ncbi:DUF4376 domain-containing protein [Oricola indica]|jgi:fermentation-respiration switch protein FrsA (DUF1100 family)|uniref:DUF4376 domain-containing protein n=1 Tax=Oricola indica TaxID=2872591 RepID=UPI001CBE77A8|nr:DUF4376 domain-containing protein [Oricola indica]
MDVYNGTFVRRWTLDHATGAIGCFHDAVDSRAMPAADIAPIEAHNAIVLAAQAELSAYEEALRVTEPEEQTQPVYDPETGEETGTEPTPAYEAWTEAQATIAATSDDVKALFAWRQGEPEKFDEEGAETAEWTAWDTVRQAAIAAFGDAPVLSVDPDEAVAARIRSDAINEERERRIVAGVSVDVTGAGAIPISGKETDIRNLQGLGMAALSRIVGGDTTTITVFRDAENQNHELLPAQVFELWQASAGYVSLLYQASWALKANDADYLDDANWP